MGVRNPCQPYDTLLSRTVVRRRMCRAIRISLITAHTPTATHSSLANAVDPRTTGIPRFTHSFRNGAPVRTGVKASPTGCTPGPGRTGWRRRWRHRGWWTTTWWRPRSTSGNGRGRCRPRGLGRQPNPLRGPARVRTATTATERTNTSYRVGRRSSTLPSDESR